MDEKKMPSEFILISPDIRMAYRLNKFPPDGKGILNHAQMVAEVGGSAVQP
ncbi:MAG: hypothetical protein IIA72_20840 [Proteobacteria bacterium]|nr:hypothetical protein [Pseudomonadota bacterium]